MSFKFSYISLKDEDEDFRPIALLPCLVFVKDKAPDTPESWGLIIAWFGGGVAMTYTKPIVKKFYVVCKQPIPDLLTRNKEYELIEEIGKCYVVKRDDGTQNVISKTRFHSPIKK
jgi:hypothetical protein